MRLLLALAPLLVAGCLQPGPSPAPSPAPASLLPPTLLIDRGSQNGSLQFYVHAKQGNVRYDWINLTLAPPGEAGNFTRRSPTNTVHDAYALDVVADQPRLDVRVEAVAGERFYAWAAGVALNLTGARPTLHILPMAGAGAGASGDRNVTLPFEELLVEAVRR